MFVFIQLEETNNTLTKDVDLITKENSEISEKLKKQEEGMWCVELEFTCWGMN